MEEFLSKDGSVTILLFCFLLTLTIVFHILGFWKSYREYSRKQEEGNRKMNRTNVKGTDNQIANVNNAGQEIHHESNSKAGCKDKHQTIKI